MVMGTVEPSMIDDLKGLSQPKQFYDSIIL